MAEDKSVNGNNALAESAPRVIVIDAKEQPENIKLRVAAYARVSSSSDEQLDSFAAQNRYYTALISGEENWELVDIYADEGITGTSAEKREDFQRLMSDCRRGKVDRVLVKSISRFARNTKECLEAIRELKGLGIGVVFEKECIDTGKISGEMLTSMFASMAQAESESISSNMRWSYRRRMERGTFLPSSVPYGYTILNKEIIVDDEQAQIVRGIFKDYLAGMSLENIADSLNAAGISRGRNTKAVKWYTTTVQYILTNEKYIGDSLWQKYYFTDTLPHRKIRNHGERAKYYAESTHPAIINKADFAAVQKLMQQRANVTKRELTQTVFRGKIFCGNCGSFFRRFTQQDNIFWGCQRHSKNKAACPVTRIAETEVQAAFLRLYYKLKHQGQAILKQMLGSLQTIRSRRMLWSLDIVELNKQIAKLSSQNQKLAEFQKLGLIDSDIFIAQSNALAEQIHNAKLQKERLLDSDGDDAISQTQELLEILADGPDLLDSFDAEMFGALVEKIIVESNERIRFRLKNGLELPETIARTVR